MLRDDEPFLRRAGVRGPAAGNALSGIVPVRRDRVEAAA